MTEDIAPYGRRRVVGVIQARVGSVRLPRKVLRPISGRPMIVRVWERLRLCRELDRLMAAIPNTSDNDRLAAILERDGLAYVRGPEENVASRLLCAVEETSADAIVRITADEPLSDPEIVDRLVVAWRKEPNLEYVSNVYPESARGWPEGLDAEVFRGDLLALLNRIPEAQSSPSAWLWQHPEHMRHAALQWTPNEWRAGPLAALHWSVDTAEDLEGARRVWAQLPEGFSWQDVIQEFGLRGLPDIGRMG